METSTCDALKAEPLLRADSYPQLWGEHEKPYPRFHRLFIKNLLIFLNQKQEQEQEQEQE